MKATVVVILIVCLNLLCVKVFSQLHALVASTHSYPERVSVVEASVDITEFHERLFWPIYEQYQEKQEVSLDCALQAFKQLATAESKSAANAYKCVHEFILAQHDALAIKREYFQKMSKGVNGFIALQFLQTEALYDLIMKSDFYGKFEWTKPVTTLLIEEEDSVKRSFFDTTLSLSDEEAVKFWPLYDAFQFDYSRVVGEQLLWFEQYIEDASLLTPGQCKHLGEAFLKMQQAEINVKEKYVQQIANTLGAAFASRFFALEDYFSVLAKMKVWAAYTNEFSQGN